jgi:hypothetical protein
MKNEAGLRPVKRAYGSRRLVRASLHGATRRFMRAQRVLHIANGDPLDNSLTLEEKFIYGITKLAERLNIT